MTLAALISVIVTVSGGNQEYAPAIYSGRNFDSSEVAFIAISDEKQHEYIDGMKVKGNTSKFSFYCNTEISVSKQDSLVPIAFSNPTMSENILLCTIVNEDGVIVYRSLGVVPGRFITNVRFSQYLKFGMNEFTMYVSAFEPTKDSDEILYNRVGTQKVKIKVACGEDYGS